MPVDLTELERSQVDGTWKGIPPGEPGMAVGDVASRGWNVLRGDVPFPAAILRDDVLRHNSDWMRRFLALSGAKLCPHGKTTMAPQLFARQLADGAWGITLATMQQVAVARRFGVRRILLANQVTSRPAIDYISAELDAHADFEFCCLVDSPAGVRLLDEALRRRGARRRLDVLVELGVTGKRCGCRGVDEGLAVARAVAATETLALRGVEGFEGVISHPDAGQAAQLVREFLAGMLELTRRCQAERLFAPGRTILTAGGSVFFDLVASGFAGAGLGELVDVVIRSGCYLTHDSAILDRMYQELLARAPDARALGPGLRAGLEVWTQVQSRPEPTRVILTMGKRDVSFDADLPIPSAWHRPGATDSPRPLSEHRVVSLNDQHALVDVPADSPLEVGDLVSCGISHPCTTFDRWPVLLVVNEAYDVLVAVRTYF